MPIKEALRATCHSDLMRHLTTHLADVGVANEQRFIFGSSSPTGRHPLYTGRHPLYQGGDKSKFLNVNCNLPAKGSISGNIAADSDDFEANTRSL
jgi:hypothetical protein